jgi:adenylyltransferase/sulfurtransferase
MKKPWIYGAGLGSYGISFPVIPGETPCLRCYYSAPPPAGTFETCESAGILSPIIHIIAANQFTQAVKYLIGTPVSKAILQVDIWNDEWRTVHFDKPVPDCICCAEREFEFLDGRYRTGATLLCGRNAVQITPEERRDIDLREFAERFSETQLILFNEYLMKLSLGEFELTLFKNGRAMVKGTDDPSVARSLYSRFIGC